MRLPPGILREVDADTAQRWGGARREEWPEKTQTHGLRQRGGGLTYTPGDRKNVVADDIQALLLPFNERRAASGDSLVEDMLLKAASASTGFNSVPWDTGGDNSDAQDYLRSIMSQMNREVTVVDPTDEDIQQIIDDPDAFIARTTGAFAFKSEQLVCSPLMAASQSAMERAMTAAADRGKGTRRGKLLQGATFRPAPDVGRFDVLGLPDSPAQARRRDVAIESWADDAASSAQQHTHAQSHAHKSPATSPAAGASGRNAWAAARNDEQVSIEEMVDRKQEQAQEMQVCACVFVCVRCVCVRVRACACLRIKRSRTDAYTHRPTLTHTYNLCTCTHTRNTNV